jgi:S-DNA-T family DNA segregation ATPase FtsK/SpoIIIE
LAGLPHLLRPVLSDCGSIQTALETLVELMLIRDREGRIPASASHSGEPRVVVVIDELADLLMMTGKETQQALTRLSQRGREAGIHLIACTQKPASQVVGSLAKANFPVRLVGRVTSPEDAKVASGYAGTGAEHLRGLGDFIAVSGGQITRFQAAYVSAQDMVHVVRDMLWTERDRQPAEPARRVSRRSDVPLGHRADWVGGPHVADAGHLKRVADSLRRRLPANR